MVTKAQIRRLEKWWNQTWNLVDPKGLRIVVNVMLGVAFAVLYMASVCYHPVLILFLPVAFVIYLIIAWLLLGLASIVFYLFEKIPTWYNNWYEQLPEGDKEEDEI